jgi:ribosomal-protein-alanine N-acetyltransferase
MTTTAPAQPVRETPRLALRALRPDDEEAVFGLLADERVVRYMLFPVFTREQAREFVTRSRDQSGAGAPAHVVLAIAARGGGPLLGICGLVLRPVEEGEAWYLLRPDLWGQGMATEAARALVDYGFWDLRLHRIWASCLPDNPASARVLEKTGFRREGYLRKNLRVHGVWRDSYLYGLLAEEWLAGPGGPVAPG